MPQPRIPNCHGHPVATPHPALAGGAQSQEKSLFLSWCHAFLPHGARTKAKEDPAGRPLPLPREIQKGRWASGLCQPFSKHELGWAPTGRLCKDGYSLFEKQEPKSYCAVQGQLFLPTRTKKGEENLPQPQVPKGTSCFADAQKAQTRTTRRLQGHPLGEK